MSSLDILRCAFKISSPRFYEADNRLASLRNTRACGTERENKIRAPDASIHISPFHFSSAFLSNPVKRVNPVQILSLIFRLSANQGSRNHAL